MNKDPTCSDCRSTFSTTVMIPGTSVCTPGWHPQYSGCLMAGYSGHAAGSEYICVNSRLQSRLSSDTDQDGKLLCYTVTRCGSLPCEPYVNNIYVSCRPFTKQFKKHNVVLSFAAKFNIFVVSVRKTHPAAESRQSGQPF